MLFKVTAPPMSLLGAVKETTSATTSLAETTAADDLLSPHQMPHPPGHASLALQQDSSSVPKQQVSSRILLRFPKSHKLICSPAEDEDCSNQSISQHISSQATGLS